jgi:hypothetical protein
MNESVEGFYENASTDTVNLEPKRPDLTVTCRAGKTRIWVNTQLEKQGDDSRREVRVRFDDAPPLTTYWWPTTNGAGDYVLVVSDRDAASFLAKVAAAHVFLFEFADADERKYVVSFDVRGLNDIVTADVNRENNSRRLMAEIEKKPAPSSITVPCNWF